MIRAPQPSGTELPASAHPGDLGSGERIESGWWDGQPIARDYYPARNALGGQFRIFREIEGARRWFFARDLRVITGYAEFHCLSNFTFLRGASHPEELVAQARHGKWTSSASATTPSSSSPPTTAPSSPFRTTASTARGAARM